MTLVYRDDEIPVERDALLSELVLLELESMLLSKEQYDIDFPQHIRPLSLSDLWRLARSSTVEKLSAPRRTRSIAE
ncbi:hypothetical protein ACFL2Q_07575 [Thermodesulfobacteriota bacterium]